MPLKYRRKPQDVNATQWFKEGDHPLVRTIGTIEHMQVYVFGDERGTASVEAGDWIIEPDTGAPFLCRKDEFAELYDPIQ